MTELEAIKNRHSVRKYQDRPLDESAVAALQDEITKLNIEGDLHMQLVLNERKAFKGFLSYGSFSNVSNYIMIVGKKSESLEYRAGYYGEKLVLFAQSIGLNTCFVGLTYKKIDGAFESGIDEKTVLCIAIGYGEADGYRMHKIKRPDQVSNINADSPEWFRKGVEAALLAPTAINQQKFYFEYIPEDKVKPIKGSSLAGYTKIDLGIAMYNFEIGAGRDNFHWVDSPI
ncbi:MAG: nitroreductase [Muribaculaceae bacterium]|nr:nitroreductase [Muribaculaceae bacterium]